MHLLSLWIILLIKIHLGSPKLIKVHEHLALWGIRPRQGRFLTSVGWHSVAEKELEELLSSSRVQWMGLGSNLSSWDLFIFLWPRDWPLLANIHKLRRRCWPRGRAGGLTLPWVISKLWSGGGDSSMQAFVKLHFSLVSYRRPMARLSYLRELHAWGLPLNAKVSSGGGGEPSMGSTPHACKAWVSSTHLPQVS